MNDKGEQKEDLKVPEGEMGEKLKEDFKAGKELTVTVQAALESEAIITYKVDAKA